MKTFTSEELHAAMAGNPDAMTHVADVLQNPNGPSPSRILRTPMATVEVESSVRELWTYSADLESRIEELEHCLTLQRLATGVLVGLLLGYAVFSFAFRG